ncbi:hypothetical protein KIN20_008276 [Parelaphostrongylus tenuis]|uniref:Uncharacterized protein n=1 Tax=Parelaphostrongylus tenuis TaxID=148309 RepID=A0AAD5M6M2_PARTN|nr:hypothetical protein KIN20_008276 [Parelaphostrongylus tenuis]
MGDVRQTKALRHQHETHSKARNVTALDWAIRSDKLRGVVRAPIQILVNEALRGKLSSKSNEISVRRFLYE